MALARERRGRAVPRPTGLPWLTVDMEHTHTDIQTAAMMFGAIADAGCVPIVRVPDGRHDYIKSVLDCGAMGIVAPMVMTAEEARSIVAATKYPPRGNRSVGGGLHAMNYGATAEEYYRAADDEILVIIQTEHISAVEIADEIYSVPGIDAIFVGPNDLAATMRAEDGTPPTKEVFEATLQRILAAAKRQGVPCGLHVFSLEDAKRRIAEGWQFIAVNSELKMMLQGASAVAKEMHPSCPRGSWRSIETMFRTKGGQAPSSRCLSPFRSKRLTKSASRPFDEFPHPIQPDPADDGGVAEPESFVEQFQRDRTAISDRPEVGDHAREVGDPLAEHHAVGVGLLRRGRGRGQVVDVEDRHAVARGS